MLFTSHFNTNPLTIKQHSKPRKTFNNINYLNIGN